MVITGVTRFVRSQKKLVLQKRDVKKQGDGESCCSDRHTVERDWTSLKGCSCIYLCFQIFVRGQSDELFLNALAGR